MFKRRWKSPWEAFSAGEKVSPVAKTRTCSRSRDQSLGLRKILSRVLVLWLPGTSHATSWPPHSPSLAPDKSSRVSYQGLLGSALAPGTFGHGFPSLSAALWDLATIYPSWLYLEQRPVHLLLKTNFPALLRAPAPCSTMCAPEAHLHTPHGHAVPPHVPLWATNPQLHAPSTYPTACSAPCPKRPRPLHLVADSPAQGAHPPATRPAHQPSPRPPGHGQAQPPEGALGLRASQLL